MRFAIISSLMYVFASSNRYSWISIMNMHELIYNICKSSRLFTYRVQSIIITIFGATKMRYENWDFPTMKYRSIYFAIITLRIHRSSSLLNYRNLLPLIAQNSYRNFTVAHNFKDKGDHWFILRISTVNDENLRRNRGTELSSKKRFRNTATQM